MSTPSDEAIRSAMTELTLNAARSTAVRETLTGITSAAVHLMDGVDAADVLLIAGDEYRSVAPTSDVAPRIDQAQRRRKEGPCLDAAGPDLIVRCANLLEDSRWPAFSADAADAGVHSVLSYQLFTHGSDRGAMNLFGFEPHAFTEEEKTIGAMLASHAAVALIAADRQRQFDSALASRDAIGQAKGMIMERFDVDAARAFELLRKLSQDTNTPVHELAGELVKRGADRRRRPS